MSRLRAGITGLTAGILAVLSAGGCGSDDDDAAAAPDPTEVVGTRAASHPTAATTSSPPQSSVIVASTDVPTTTVTEEPTTTVDPVAVATEKAAAAYDAKERAWSTCLSQLPACDTAALADAYAEPQLSHSQALAEEWNTAGYRAEHRLPHPSHRGRSINQTFDEAVLTVCVTDGGVVFLPSPDGQSEQIIDDTWYSARESWTVVEIADGAWRVSDNDTLTDAVIGEENNVCD